MKIVTVAVAATLLMAGTADAAKPDPRLASISVVQIAAGDKLSDDTPVVGCVVERLGELTPLSVATDARAHDAVLTIHDSSVGKHPKAKATVTALDGAVLWEGGSKARGFNMVGRDMRCPLAKDILDSLRKAMKSARDGK